MIKRKIFYQILERPQEPRQFIQVLLGPRQVGKTTIAQQIIKTTNGHIIYGSADVPTLRNHIWIKQQWELARIEAQANREVLLIFDEIQKISNWSEIIKSLWDEDSRKNIPIKLLLLGSSTLLIKKDLTESLAGRFEINRATHWSFSEMNKAFGWNIDQYIYFGGYPGSAALVDNESRWNQYILDSLIETSISKDILLINQVNKAILLKRLFQLGCHYSGQILSYQKMLGQLDDAGNTTTLAHYLDLLSTAGLLTGLEKFTTKMIKQKSSSPKFQALNTALISAQSSLNFNEARKDLSYWGRLTESAVGAYLVNYAPQEQIEVTYWRDRGQEVDFILKKDKKLVAIEVKTNLQKSLLPGLGEFEKKFNPWRLLIVGDAGFSVEKFLKTPLSYWFK